MLAIGGRRVRALRRAEIRHVIAEDPVAIDADDVADAGREQQLRDGGPRRTDAEGDDPHVLEALADDLQRVDERRRDDDRGAVLVVVEHRDVEQFGEPALDLEAARRGDVLEVDAAEDRRDVDHRLDDLVDVLGGEAERKGVDVAELLEEHRLALHHRDRRVRADVAETEHGAAVADDRHGVALDGEVPDAARILGDGEADPRDPGRVDHRQVVTRADRVTRA